MTGPSWSAKLATLFLTPPWGALAGTEDEARKAGDSLRDRLGVSPFGHALDAWQIAFGPEGLLLSRLQWPSAGVPRTFRHRMANKALESPPMLPEHRRQVEALIDQVREAHLGTQPNHRAAFLALWRLLPSVVENSGARWPADPRLPQHNYFDHQAIAAATSGTWRENAGFRPAILLFTIASAQEHVANARRTQDFWMGSYLLSNLMWAALQWLAENFGPDAVLSPNLRGYALADRWLNEIGVFPLGTTLTQQFEAVRTDNLPDNILRSSIPNIVSVLLPHDAADEAARCMQKAVKVAFAEIAKDVREYVEVGATGKSRYQDALGQAISSLAQDDSEWRKIWERQVADGFSGDIYWTVQDWPVERSDFDQFLDRTTQLLGGDHAPGVHDIARKLLTHFPGSDKSGAMYPQAAQLAGRFLAARKIVRSFIQYDEPGEKSSLSGTHQALTNGSPVDVSISGFWSALADLEVRTGNLRVKLRGRIRRGERLSASDLTRRLALEASLSHRLNIGGQRIDYHLFPSTSSMAVANFKHCCLETLREDRGLGNGPSSDFRTTLKNYAEAVTQFLENHDLYLPASILPRIQSNIEGMSKALQDTAKKFVRLDGDWLFPESFDIAHIVREYSISEKSLDADALKNALLTLQDFLAEARRAGAGDPGRYYAILAADGDHMGDWITRGAVEEVYLREAVADPDAISAVASIQRPLTPADHATLAAALRNFSLRVAPRIVEDQNLGKLVFAGGDDVLALVATEDALAVAAGLADAFQRPWDDDPSFVLPGGRASLKAGVVFVHHSHPLGMAIRETREEALKKDARDGLNRDGCAIRLLKRSGQPLVTGVKWRDAASKGSAMDMVGVLIEVFAGRLHSRLRLSAKVIGEIAVAARSFDLIDDPQQRRDAIRAEVGRLWTNHLAYPDEDPQARSAATRATEAVFQLLDLLIRHPWKDRNLPAMERLAGLLKTARFVASGT